MSATISRRVVFEVIGQTHPITNNALRVRIILRSDPAAPETVSLFFRHGAGCTTVRWVARDLLIDGVAEPASLGPVRVEPDGLDWVAIWFPAPIGATGFHVRRQTLINFLAAAAEHVDIAGELDTWLRTLTP